MYLPDVEKMKTVCFLCIGILLSQLAACNSPPLTSAPLEDISPSSTPLELNGYINPDDPGFSYTFSSLMDQNSVAQAFKIKPPIPYILNWDDRTLMVTLSKTPVPGQVYLVEISDRAKTRNGESLLPIQLNYMADGISVAYYMHRWGEINADFRLTFNYPMDRDAVAAALRFEPALTYSLSWENDQHLSIIPDEQFVPNTEYIIALDTQAVDKTGVPLAKEQSWKFLSAPLQMDFEGVYLRNELPNLFFKFYFNYMLPADDLVLDLSVEPEFPFIVNWDANYKEFTVIPEDAISSEQKHIFTLDLKGIADSPYAELNFKALHDFTTPRIAISLERQDDTNRNSPLIFQFSYPMNPDSVDAAISLTPHVDYKLDWQNGNRTALLTPLESFPIGGKLSVQIAATAADATGKTITLSREWTFDLPPP